VQGFFAKLTGLTIGVGAGASGGVGRAGLGVGAESLVKWLLAPADKLPLKPLTLSTLLACQDRLWVGPEFWVGFSFLSRMPKIPVIWPDHLFKEPLVPVLAMQVELTWQLAAALSKYHLREELALEAKAGRALYR
jgi:hypothetical protein